MATEQVEKTVDDQEALSQLTVDPEETVRNRVKREPEFAEALLAESVSLFLNGEPDIARLMLRDLVNATIGFEQLAIETAKPSKSLHRMLSVKGNPTMDNLSGIIGALRKDLKVKSIEVTSIFEELLQSA